MARDFPLLRNRREHTDLHLRDARSSQGFASTVSVRSPEEIRRAAFVRGLIDGPVGFHSLEVDSREQPRGRFNPSD